MDYKNKLVLQMGIFFILVVGIFSYIVLNEKKYEILTPKVEEKMNKYIDKKFAKEKIDLNIDKIKLDKYNKDYKIKLSNSKNKHLYFYVIYKNKKITDTYKKDYVEGKSLFNYTSIKYQKTFTNSKIIFTNKLNKYPNTIYNQIITEDIKTLPIYKIEKELTLKDSNIESIIKSITKFNNKIKKRGYNPKYYDFILVNENDVSFNIKIENLDNNLINTSLNPIITGIINNDKSIEQIYNISFKYND